MEPTQQDDLSQLTEAAKIRIRAEEQYRFDYAIELTRSAATPKKRTFWAFVNSSFGIWFLTTCVAGIISFIYTSVQQEKEKKADAAAKQATAEIQAAERKSAKVQRDASMATVLLPYLAGQDTNLYAMAIGITSYLKASDELPPRTGRGLAAKG